MLQTKQIGEFTAFQAGLLHVSRRLAMMKELERRQSEFDEEVFSVLAIYPHIAGCVEPRLTIERFMQIPEQELDKLTEAALELNPHWFALPEDEKKTEAPLIESTAE